VTPCRLQIVTKVSSKCSASIVSVKQLNKTNYQYVRVQTFSNPNHYFSLPSVGGRGGPWRRWLRHCATSRKVAGSFPDGASGIFYWHNPSGRTMALRSIQSVTEMSKSKGLPQQAEAAQGVPGMLRPRIFLTFRHYKGGRSSAMGTGRLYPMINSWYSFSEAESTSGHMVLSG